MPSQCRSKFCPKAFLLAISIYIREIIPTLALTMFSFYCPLLTIASALLTCVARSVFSGLEKHTATLACGLVMAFSALYYNPISFVCFALGAGIALYNNGRSDKEKNLDILCLTPIILQPVLPLLPVLSSVLGFKIAANLGRLYQEVKHDLYGDRHLGHAATA